MGKVTFANSKVNETISGESQKYRSHITSAGVYDTGSLAAEVAENLKDSAAYVETILHEATNASKKHLALGERVTIDGLCRLEIAADGASPSEDSPWNPAVNHLVVNAIPYDGVKFAAKDIVPENVLKPVAIQLLGSQDATTFEQNAVAKGHTLLCQGKGLKLTAANPDEGLFLVADDGAEHKLAVTSSTQGEIDATVPDEVPAGEYTLEVRGRAGNGTNRMLVSARISGFTVKEG